MVCPLSINIIYDTTCTNEVNNTIEFIKQILTKLKDSINLPISTIKMLDIREPLTHSDINIHLEIPIFSAISWAHTNIMFVNPEKWSTNYDSYAHSFDALIFSDTLSADKSRTLFDEKAIDTDNIYVVPWGDTVSFDISCKRFLPILQNIMDEIKIRRPTKGDFFCPPILNHQDCPHISIITPTYNRQKLIDIAFHNLLATDYPKDKIEWIVIEDNEKTHDMSSEKIISFQIQVPDIKIKYIPIEGRMSIGEKRNHAIENASNDIILFMDDDDHYPETSFRRRVAWLTKGTKRGEIGKSNIVCCTTIALYDLKQGISAVNVPPYNIPFAQRISEATLTFNKSAWIERKFSNVSISEGEEWISGRENQVIEIQPQQIIVAFSHNNNQSSRRIPPSNQKPACFWGFPEEYLVFIHGLVDIEIENNKKNETNNLTKQ
jgi:hypothetical protein